MRSPASTSGAVNPFAETGGIRRKIRNERIAQTIFAVMVVCILIPLVLFLGYLISKG